MLKDGILAMILDLALQFAGTTSVYVAAFVSLQDMYQLSAAGAALPQFSAYATAVGPLDPLKILEDPWILDMFGSSCRKLTKDFGENVLV